MPYAIKASYYLGLYQGRNATGVPEPYPTPARLYSALVAGARSLERLEGCGEEESLASQDADAFAWLEDNPPDAICVPETMPASSLAISFRNKGETSGFCDKGKSATSASVGTAVNGPIGWYWNQVPVETVRNRIDAIAHEVPYLGEAVCPVRLTTSLEDIPSKALRRCEPSFEAQSFPIVTKGRADELQSSFLALKKTVKDKRNKNEEENLAEVPTSCLANAYYRRGDLESTSVGAAPWLTGYAFKVESRSLAREDYVEWATCLHRALARYIGDDLPKIMQRLTADAISLPNGLAIQVIPASAPVRDEYISDKDSLILMIPAHAPVRDEGAILAAASKISRLYSPKLGSASVTFMGERIDLTHFWRPVPDGCSRLFETEPMFIANNRPPTRKKANGSCWTIDDDALVAIGYVWRDRFGNPAGAGKDARLLALARAVSDVGVRSCGGHVVPTQDIRRYVHKTNGGSLLVGAHALVDIAALGCDECLAAVGQTRHLGGGLLVPLDLPGRIALASQEADGHENS